MPLARCEHCQSSNVQPVTPRRSGATVLLCLHCRQISIVPFRRAFGIETQPHQPVA